MDVAKLLVNLYNEPGWKHFEKWINDQITNSVIEIMSPETPKEMVDTLRSQAYAYQSILDKVAADKLTLTEMEKSHKGE